MPLQPYLKQIAESRASLSRAQAAELLQTILRGEATDLEIAAVLSALATRGETPAEIAGFVDTMRAAAISVPLDAAERTLLVDTCGTGADLSGTFNISTAAALVAAAAGASAEITETGVASTRLMVAKHGNRAVTSKCGSADVLEALGIPVGLSPADGAASLRKHRFAFFHAPSLHPAMKIVMPVRRALGIRTIFHLVGPLSNPAGASAQVMGVYAEHLVPIVAEAMALLHTRHAFVVHGHNDNALGNASSTGSAISGNTHNTGLDEISISGPTHIAEVREGKVTLSIITPEDAGLTRASSATLIGGDAQTNATILRAIFSGERSPRRDIVLLNAAAVLVAADLAANLTEGVQRAARAIDTGAVTELIATLSHKG
ncbi:MAG: anthranilate phosphoribosyltransferase [Edaphobacter sp.]